MGASPTKALAPNFREEPMGANSTQAVAIVFMLIGFTLLAGAFAGGGIILWGGRGGAARRSRLLFHEVQADWSTRSRPAGADPEQGDEANDYRWNYHNVAGFPDQRG